MEDRDKDNKIDEETTVTSEGGEQKPDGAAPKSDGDDDYEKFVMSAVVRRARPVQ